VLDFTLKEDFPNVVDMYQDGAGSSYYLKLGRPQRLYAKSTIDNSEVVAFSPSEIVHVYRIDNDIYFQTEDHKSGVPSFR
ncbi:hypothetical protein PMAYCL1PPCAC_08282, partial [Pristionchus mayeri]